MPAQVLKRPLTARAHARGNALLQPCLRAFLGTTSAFGRFQLRPCLVMSRLLGSQSIPYPSHFRHAAWTILVPQRAIDHYGLLAVVEMLHLQIMQALGHGVLNATPAAVDNESSDFFAQKLSHLVAP
jgi:hypothetical protein